MYEVYDSNQDGWTPQAFHDVSTGEVLAWSSPHRRTARNLVDIIPKAGSAWARIEPAVELPVRVAEGRRLRQAAQGARARMGVVDKPETGPYFGPEGLTIPLFSKSPRRARCKLGPYYQRMPSVGTPCSRWRGRGGSDAVHVCRGLGRRADSLFDDAIPCSV